MSELMTFDAQPQKRGGASGTKVPFDALVAEFKRLGFTLTERQADAKRDGAVVKETFVDVKVLTGAGHTWWLTTLKPGKPSQDWFGSFTRQEFRGARLARPVRILEILNPGNGHAGGFSRITGLDAVRLAACCCRLFGAEQVKVDMPELLGVQGQVLALGKAPAPADKPKVKAAK